MGLQGPPAVGGPRYAAVAQSQAPGGFPGGPGGVINGGVGGPPRMMPGGNTLGSPPGMCFVYACVWGGWGSVDGTPFPVLG
jgi:hypothetical protein